ncbi:MAG: hypothetical protein M3463_05825 [Verrucomicrobiota bacterium]|nr:hypothetical protein [Verrucomicrobiota bacterium]
MSPLERDNAMPFRQEILDFAREVKMGLMTAWDLFRFVRSAMKLGWSPEQARPVFYHIGRIAPVPAHYQYLGVIAHVWTGVVSIQVEAGELRLGDRVAFELDTEFEEQDITSLQVEKAALEIAQAGTRAVTETKLCRPTLHDGVRVFLVRK